MPDTTDSDQDSSTLTRIVAFAKDNLPVAAALVIGVFAALGIQGDTLGRLLRNEPTLVLWAIVLAVVALAMAFVARKNVLASWVCVGILAVAVALAGVAGIGSYGLREQPNLILKQASNADGTTTVSASAAALSLSTGDHMLLRLVAFPSATTMAQAQQSCRSTRGPQGGVAEAPSDPETHFALLYWGESGPTATGSASSEATVTVNPKTHPLVCGIAVLSEARDDKTLTYQDGERFSSVFIHLGDATGAVPPTQAAKAAAGS